MRLSSLFIYFYRIVLTCNGNGPACRTALWRDIMHHQRTNGTQMERTIISKILQITNIDVNEVNYGYVQAIALINSRFRIESEQLVVFIREML